MYEVNNMKHQKELLEVVLKYETANRNDKWNFIRDEMNKRFNQDDNKETWRSRYRTLAKDFQKTGEVTVPTASTFKKEKKIFANGDIEELDLVELTNDEIDSPEAFLKAIKRNPDNWELISCNASIWQTHTKLQTTKQLYACKYKLRPIIKEIDLDECIKNINNTIQKGIKPLKIEKQKKNKKLDDNKMIEQAPIELHLGKLSCKMDTKENYDYKIARDRFEEIVSKTIEIQEQEKAGTLLLSIGGDFFNSDNEADTTTKGTQQHSDVRGNKMFLVGVEMWIKALKTYKDSNRFNKIKLVFVPGNHDLNTSFHLYVTLMKTFENDKTIEFSDDFTEMQCITFGKCMIVQTHGSKNINRTMDSIVSEFPKEYGETEFRELHLGHLHTEMELKERLGIIPRRLSTPGGKCSWEYNERFGRNITKQMMFVWNKDTGLEQIKMIPFERELGRVKTIKRK